MTLQTVFRRKIDQLHKQHGRQGWWPRIIIQNSKSKKQKYIVKHYPGTKSCWMLRGKMLEVWEVGMGAILTQNTAWSNVEKALMSLAQAGVLAPQQVLACPTRRLESLTRPAGYYKQKAKKLKILAHFFFDRHAELDSASRYRVTRNAGVGILNRVQDDRVMGLRHELLGLWGVGPETADTILLYGFGFPVFVVDAYTRRLLVSLSNDQSWLTRPYDEVREFCEESLNRYPLPDIPSGHPPLLKGERGGIRIYQESHALIVRWGKVSKLVRFHPAR